MTDKQAKFCQHPGPANTPVRFVMRFLSFLWQAIISYRIAFVTDPCRPRMPPHRRINMEKQN